MPPRPTSAGKKDSKKGKKGKKKSTKSAEVDPHQEELDRLIREREDLRSKFNVVCSRIIENVNMEDYQADVDLSKQQPSDIPINLLLSMIEQICYYRVAFLSLFQEADDQRTISVHRKVTQLAIDEPEMFRRRLTPEQRLTFVTKERDIWKENAQILQTMYAAIVDQLEVGVFKKVTQKSEEIINNHRLNLDDVCLVFSSSRVRSINDAQKLRAKKSLDQDLNDFRNQQAFFDLDPTEPKNSVPLKTNPINLEISQPSNNRIRSASTRRSVSFAPEVNVFNEDEDNETTPTAQQMENDSDEHFQTTTLQEIQQFSFPEQNREKFSDSDYFSVSSNSSNYEHQNAQKSALPSKYRLPIGSEILVNKMDSNLRMLIIKELSKTGHNERPLSRMSSNYGINSSNRKVRRSPSEETPEWIELARLIGIDESEIDHWASQNLQYPAGRVISAWCNYGSPAPTVAELHTVLTSKELRRADLARYIETMYIIQ